MPLEGPTRRNSSLQAIAEDMPLEGSTHRRNPSPHEITENIPLDTIRTEYHPHTKSPPKVVKFEEYREYYSQRRRPTARNPTKPWSPFRTRAEFEFAEIALDAALNKRQVDALLKLFHRCIEGQDQFGLKDHTDLTEMWELASVLHARVCSSARPTLDAQLKRCINCLG